MNSKSSSSETQSSAFYQLDERIQRWIWQRGWTELKDAQERAVAPILRADTDLIIAAATASGKTEAAFLPILTRLLKTKEPGACILYISPLKALINDQWKRLEELCKALKVPVFPWHGDAPRSRKAKFLKQPSGCLLITPESLEGLLMREGHALSSIFNQLLYVVVDELHAFIDSVRGKQLQSQLHRIDIVLKRRIPRIALSATLGDMSLAAEFLRPQAGDTVSIVESKDRGQVFRVVVKGYYNLPPRLTQEEVSAREMQRLPTKKEEVAPGILAISEELFSTLRGSNHLVFPNSRGKVELYADLLRRACEQLGVPNEFWPHHGSLSKDIREETEQALKAGDRPSTAITTTTLELGIDIGAIKSVAQIGPAPAVASLRQRLGRSGRRKGEAAILRCFCLEEEINVGSSLSDQLRQGLVQTIAQIQLLTNRWYEPPRIYSLHLSTLIQQLLSLIAEYGGMNAEQAWKILCESGLFPNLSRSEFAKLLRGLGDKGVLMQDSTGLLLHGAFGERLINHYSFLAAFTSDEEFRIICADKTLGTLPISRPLTAGSYVIFAGRRWRALSCCQDEKRIDVEPAKGGRPPLFDGLAGKVHDRVREEMRVILSQALPVSFLDQTALRQLREARETYTRFNLEQKSIFQSGNEVRVFTWKGDWINDTLAIMFASRGLKASNEGLFVVVFNEEANRVFAILREIANKPVPAGETLAETVQNKYCDKWDSLLTNALLCKTFATCNLDVKGAHATAGAIVL